MAQLDVRELSIEQAWHVFITEIDTQSREYQQARFGHRLKFDIYETFKGYFTIKPKTGKIYIRTKAYRLEDFHTEMEIREKQIKRWILENMGEEEIARAWES